MKSRPLLLLPTVVGILTLTSCDYIANQLKGQAQGAKIQLARVKLSALQSAIDMFHLDVGRYPSTTEGLAALVTPPSDIERWDGPYIQRTEDLTDPWQHPFHYEEPGQESQPYDVMSFGADGAPGGTGESADIWAKTKTD